MSRPLALNPTRRHAAAPAGHCALRRRRARRSAHGRRTLPRAGSMSSARSSTSRSSDPTTIGEQEAGLRRSPSPDPRPLRREPGALPHPAGPPGGSAGHRGGPRTALRSPHPEPGRADPAPRPGRRARGRLGDPESRRIRGSDGLRAADRGGDDPRHSVIGAPHLSCRKAIDTASLGHSRGPHGLVRRPHAQLGIRIRRPRRRQPAAPRASLAPRRAARGLPARRTGAFRADAVGLRRPRRSAPRRPALHAQSEPALQSTAPSRPAA